jgi:hypothetical protein
MGEDACLCFCLNVGEDVRAREDSACCREDHASVAIRREHERVLIRCRVQMARIDDESFGRTGETAHHPGAPNNGLRGIMTVARRVRRASIARIHLRKPGRRFLPPFERFRKSSRACSVVSKWMPFKRRSRLISEPGCQQGGCLITSHIVVSDAACVSDDRQIEHCRRSEPIDGAVAPAHQDFRDTASIQHGRFARAALEFIQAVQVSFALLQALSQAALSAGRLAASFIRCSKPR